MDRYCVMGNPVAHSKSPWIHARFAELTGQAIEYKARLVPLKGFAAAVREFRASGGHGCNVTVPFKFEAANLPDLGGRGGVTHRTPRATLAGACNTLRFDADGVLADNTDGIGLVRDIVVNAGVPLEGARVLVVGAGGASAGVLGPLMEAGVRELTLANRTLSNALVVAGRHTALATACGVELRTAPLDKPGEAYDIVINASASSLAGESVPVSPRVLRAGALALDMMYGPPAQGFLDWAARHGAQPRDGLGMLVEQAAESFEIWRGVRPPSAQVLDELRAEMAHPAA